MASSADSVVKLSNIYIVSYLYLLPAASLVSRLHTEVHEVHLISAIKFLSFSAID